MENYFIPEKNLSEKQIPFHLVGNILKLKINVIFYWNLYAWNNFEDLIHKI